MSFAIYSTNLTEDGELDMSLSAAPAVADPAPAVAAPAPAVAAPAPAVAAPAPAVAAPATENEVTVDTLQNLSNVKLGQIEISPSPTADEIKD